jgi:DNA-binding response OmpR family regulator
MKTKKILIVEDDAFSRGAIEKLLQSYDYETFSCALAEEAIVRLKQESFNILITDLHMPGMDGFELIRIARIIQPGLRAIMTTGFSTEEVKYRAKENNLDGFFSKPVDWDELHALLDTLSRSDRVQDGRKGIALFRPESVLLAIILFILITFGVQPTEAQLPFYPQSKPSLRLDSQEACSQSPDLALSEVQRKELENLQRAYSAEAMPLLKEIRTSVLELRCLASETSAKPQALIDRHRRISVRRMELETLSFSYQLKAKALLTKEQLERLPNDCLLGMSTGYEMPIGVGGGPRRGPDRR